MRDDDDLIEQAEAGDLRPQFNPRAVSARLLTAEEGRRIEPILLGRFLPMARPIANARDHPHDRMRLEDAGSFFALVETLRRIGSRRLDDTLRMFLDEFAQLEQRSYDQLYLWTILELSRSEPESIDVYWPLAVTLDLQYRSEPWERPFGTTPFDQPYRFLELLFVGYIQSTLQRWLDPTSPGQLRVVRRYPSLYNCLRRIMPRLANDPRDLVIDTLRQQARQPASKESVACSDALSTLVREKSLGERGEPS